MTQNKKQNSQPRQNAPEPNPPVHHSAPPIKQSYKVRNRSRNYYGIQKPKRNEDSKLVPGGLVMLAPYFPNQGYELMDENEALQEVEFTKEEWEWIIKTQPQVKKDQTADILNGVDAILLVR